MSENAVIKESAFDEETDFDSLISGQDIIYHLVSMTVIICLSNPYGPYQRPDGILGVVTTFTYKALKDKKIIVYGDGSVIRDFIYINDVIRAVLNIVQEGITKTIEFLREYYRILD